MNSIRGFSLVETLVATAVMTTGLLALAQVLALAYAANVDARHVTIAAALAVRKAEELRALKPSAAGASVEYLDARGHVIRSGGSAPAGAAYVRRWSAALRPAGEGVLLVAVVSVDALRAGARRARPDARLVLAFPGQGP